ncbi:hypothetical protein NDN08_008385 [Rhodosorus marinus]|uniref:Anaphase-promoting complex subunit 13 n=1 Tax=Rhodosorus marinus TaxID=101924 RepID=A0AAV8V0M2_9RHOD|nr:hypothetical protein NDN08_008385 [Rhodosorus marinus]
MDSSFSAPLRFDGRLLLDVVDSEWAKEKLPVEDIQPAETAAAVLCEDDHDAVDEKQEQRKWTDLVLHDLVRN